MAPACGMCGAARRLQDTAHVWALPAGVLWGRGSAGLPRAGRSGRRVRPPGSSCLSAPRLRHDAVRIRLRRLNVVTAAVTRHVPS